MTGEANAVKALTVEFDGAAFSRIPIRTHVVMPGDDLDAFVRQYAEGVVEPGDLLFGSFGTRVAGAGHVMIVVRPGLAVQAPAAGRVVELTRYDADGVEWRLGRLPASALTKLDVSSAA